MTCCEQKPRCLYNGRDGECHTEPTYYKIEGDFEYCYKHHLDGYVCKRAPREKKRSRAQLESDESSEQEDSEVRTKAKSPKRKASQSKKQKAGTAVERDSAEPTDADGDTAADKAGMVAAAEGTPTDATEKKTVDVAGELLQRPREADAVGKRCEGGKEDTKCSKCEQHTRGNEVQACVVCHKLFCARCRGANSKVSFYKIQVESSFIKFKSSVVL